MFKLVENILQFFSKKSKKTRRGKKMIKVTDKILDTQLPKIPKEVKFCKKCVISNQRPRITFNKEGVCSACQYSYEKDNTIDWEERERQLVELLDEHRSNDGSYDVLVPGSGGKDSGIVAHMLKHKYGMNPLTVTWSPSLYTDIGRQNYDNFGMSGFDNILGVPDGKVNRKLSLLGFDLVGDPFMPFSYGQICFVLNIAVKFNIPLIFYGEHGEVEYGGTTKTKYKGNRATNDWEKIYYKGAGPDSLINEGLERGLFSENEVKSKSFQLYKPPEEDATKEVNPKMCWWSYYHKWIPNENYEYAVKHTGFKPNSSRSEGTYTNYASLDDKTDGFHYYPMFIKFGIGRATSDATHEIRDKIITRDEGVALVHKYDGEFPKKYFQTTLNYLDISENEFWYVIDKFRAKHIWEMDKGVWKLKHRVDYLDKSVKRPAPQENYIVKYPKPKIS